jgi:hypothetical protein
MNTSDEAVDTVGGVGPCGPPPWPAFLLPRTQIKIPFANTLLPLPDIIDDGLPPGCPGVGSPILATGLPLTYTFGLPALMIFAALHEMRSFFARATPGMLLSFGYIYDGQ